MYDSNLRNSTRALFVVSSMLRIILQHLPDQLQPLCLGAPNADRFIGGLKMICTLQESDENHQYLDWIIAHTRDDIQVVRDHLLEVSRRPGIPEHQRRVFETWHRNLSYISAAIDGIRIVSNPDFDDEYVNDAWSYIDHLIFVLRDCY